MSVDLPSIALVLAALEHPRVADRVREIVGAAAAIEYRTKGPRAPGVSIRTHNETCRSGRVRARKEGREWICARADWHAARSKQIERPMLHLVEKTEEQLAAEDIAAAGYRRTR